MNVISTAAATTQRGTAHAALKPMVAHDSHSTTFEDLLSRKHRDSEGGEDADGKRSRRERERTDATDASQTDTLRLLESRAQQHQTAPLPTPAPTTVAFGDATADSGTPAMVETDTMPECGGEGGGGSAKASPFMQATTASPAGSSASTPQAGAATSPSGESGEATVQQAILDSHAASPPAKSSTATDAAAQVSAVEKMISPLSLKEISASDADGTPVAKERRDMQEHPKAQLSKPSANTATGASAADAADGTEVSLVKEKMSAPRRTEPETPITPASVASPVGVTEFRIQGAAPIQMTDRSGSAAPAEFEGATHFVEHTMDLAERVSIKGGDHVEVRMRLLDGKEVTVSLHLANGEWKPVFKTESEALCRALEQSWQQTAAQPSDRSVRFSEPVFESAQSQSGTGESRDRQRDSRDRDSARQEQPHTFPAFPSRNRPAVAAADATRLTAIGKLRLYA